jgi:hypothetical protein
MTVPEVGLGFLVIARPNPQNAPPKIKRTYKITVLGKLHKKLIENKPRLTKVNRINLAIHISF